MKNPFKFNPRSRTNLLGCGAIILGVFTATEDVHGLAALVQSVENAFSMTSAQLITGGYAMIVMREGMGT